MQTFEEEAEIYRLTEEILMQASEFIDARYRVYKKRHQNELKLKIPQFLADIDALIILKSLLIK